VSAVAVGCAESAQDGKLDEGTLTSAGTVGMSVSGTAGAVNTSGASSGGTPGSAGASSAAGTGGSLASAGTAGGGMSSSGSGGDMNGGAGGMGGAAGSAGTGGAAGSAGSGGQTASGHRYAKLVATSEQGGNPWSSCAELQLFTTGDAAISRGAWVVMADSQESDDQVAPSSAIKDGDASTFWHTEWEPGGIGDSPLPHQLVIDTGATQPITGFSYLPRQDGANGRIAGWELYLSKDGTTWGAAVKTGTFPEGAAEQKIAF
jgi:hypothetical protein